jgi:hypothetical protein
MELFSYRLEHLLPFSREVYFRLFTLHNEALWPAHVAAIIFVGLIAWRVVRGDGRTVSALLALIWVFVGWTFFFERYESLLWAAPQIGIGFFVQGALFGAAAIGNWLDLDDTGGLRGVGLAVAIASVVAMPFLGPLAGRAWSGVELFGIAPDPTVVGTLGLLLAVRSRRWPFFVIPLLWCVFTGATAVAMGYWLGLVTPAAGAVVLVLSILQKRK